MTFVADESVHGAIIDRLRADGWPVLAIRETNREAADPDVLAVAGQAGAVLLTQDKDFGELVYRQQLAHGGVVLIRLAGVAAADRAGLVGRTVRDHKDELPGAFTVISSGGVRIRRPGP
jgi:predicted nuclease of predicted toxin-antitoxin system